MFATNWAEKNNLYRGPSIYASYQVSIHLAKRFQRFLEIDQPETITAYGYSVSEVKIFIEINQSAIRIAYGGHVC
jgi:hypothetical protein